MSWKQVTKLEFDAFVEAYQKPLDVNVAHMFEPPLKSWNDFCDGRVWPESMVAKSVLNTAMRGHPAYKGEPDDYYVKA